MTHLDIYLSRSNRFVIGWPQKSFGLNGCPKLIHGRHYFGICSSACGNVRSSYLNLLYLHAKTPLLIERKAPLKKLLRRKRPRILYLDHVEADGRLLFDQVRCRRSHLDTGSRSRTHDTAS